MLNQDVFLVGCIVSAILAGVILNQIYRHNPNDYEESVGRAAWLIATAFLTVIGGGWIFELIVTYKLIQ